jgi:hypothetical protein
VTSNSGKSWKKADELVGTMAVGAGVAATGWPALARVAMAFKPDPSPLQNSTDRRTTWQARQASVE